MANSNATKLREITPAFQVFLNGSDMEEGFHLLFTSPAANGDSEYVAEAPLTFDQDGRLDVEAAIPQLLEQARLDFDQSIYTDFQEELAKARYTWSVSKMSTKELLDAHWVAVNQSVTLDKAHANYQASQEMAKVTTAELAKRLDSK